MTAPAVGPCSPWATALDVYNPWLPDCDQRYANLDPYTLADALDDASSLLWRKSGKRWPGVCTTTLRPPCGTVWATRNAPEWNGYTTYGGWWQDGAVWGYGGCSCDRPTSRVCGCGGPSQIDLGRTVVEILEVIVDGTVLVNGTDYRVDDWRWLVRLPAADGSERSWPCSNDLSLPTTEDGTWAVTLAFGANPPPEGVRAAARLAGELALDRCGQECDLPSDLVRASREGLDLAFITPSKDIWEGMPLPIKAFIDAVNPKGLVKGAAVYSPDLPRRAIRTDQPSA